MNEEVMMAKEYWDHFEKGEFVEAKQILDTQYENDFEEYMKCVRELRDTPTGIIGKLTKAQIECYRLTLNNNFDRCLTLQEEILNKSGEGK